MKYLYKLDSKSLDKQQQLEWLETLERLSKRKVDKKLELKGW